MIQVQKKTIQQAFKHLTVLNPIICLQKYYDFPTSSQPKYDTTELEQIQIEHCKLNEPTYYRFNNSQIPFSKINSKFKIL